MFGHVLIIDAMSNRRIQLRASLGTRCENVVLADCYADGVKSLQSNPPDVLIIGQDTPGLDLARLCRSLKARSDTQMVRVIVAVSSETASARYAALMAGAEDVIDYAITASELQATLRSFKRRQEDWDAFQQQTGSVCERGFAEAKESFVSPARVVVVREDDGGDTPPRTAKVVQHLGYQVRSVTPKQAKRGLEFGTDVIVMIESDPHTPLHDVLGLLRTDPNSRHATLLYLQAVTQMKRISPLDLGATEAVTTDVTAQEIALRIQRLAQQKRAEDQARQEIRSLGNQAHIDSLTGLSNRAFADKYFARLDRSLSETPLSRAVIMVDVDQFKRINDNHGHAAGDIVLRHVAKVLRANLRKGDLIARLGGDEIIIALTDVEETEAKTIADRLRTSVLEAPKGIADGTHIRTTISLGLAFASRSDLQSSEALRLKADQALYAAKAAGRNRFRTAGDQRVIGATAS